MDDHTLHLSLSWLTLPLALFLAVLGVPFRRVMHREGHSAPTRCESSGGIPPVDEHLHLRNAAARWRDCCSHSRAKH